jgi:hypothetical protein
VNPFGLLPIFCAQCRKGEVVRWRLFSRKSRRNLARHLVFVRQDIVELLKNDQPLHYTVALLVCCACEMLTWHRGLRDDQAHEVFTSLLPDTEPKAAGKTLWSALRNGLAHNFRPATIKIGDDEWRFSISSRRSGPCMIITKGHPHWIHLNIRDISSRVNLQIDAYEQELRTSADARLRFHEQSGRSYVKTIHPEAAGVADALRPFFGENHA